VFPGLLALKRLDQCHTVAQALASGDYSLMEKQRIKTFSRDVFGQLGTLRW